MRYEYRNDGTLIACDNEPITNIQQYETNPQQVMRPNALPRPNRFYKTPFFYWCITLLLSIIMGLISGTLLTPVISETIGIKEITEEMSLLFTVIIIVGFISGTIIYNVKCNQNGRGFFLMKNYVLSLLASAAIGMMIIPVLIILVSIFILALFSILSIILTFVILMGLFNMF